jgi:nucleotide-binding universal stress UspA family protein
MVTLILVPLDGSKRAEVILPHVEEWAQRFEAEVALLCVIEPSTPMTSPGGTLQDVAAVEAEVTKAETYLGAIQGEFQAKGIACRHYAEYGPIVETIINVSDRVGADLIAMASHGRSGLARVFYGSVAAGVLQRVDRPLLLIRSRRPD